MKRIYLIDSGVTVNLIPNCRNLFSATPNFVDTSGHGTSMASLIRSVSKSDIFSVKISNDTSCNKEQIKQVFDFLLTQPSGIISCNWVIPFNEDVYKSITLLINKGFVVVCSAGNHSECVDKYLPAAHPLSIVVGSLNKSGDITKHSNYSGNKKINFYLTGTNMNALLHTGEIRKISGTSVSSALAAGILSRDFFERNPLEKIEKHIEFIKKKCRKNLIV